jgi:hypothetical protein
MLSRLRLAFLEEEDFFLSLRRLSLSLDFFDLFLRFRFRELESLALSSLSGEELSSDDPDELSEELLLSSPDPESSLDEPLFSFSSSSSSSSSSESLEELLFSRALEDDEVARFEVDGFVAVVVDDDEAEGFDDEDDAAEGAAAAGFFLCGWVSFLSNLDFRSSSRAKRPWRVAYQAI